MSPVPSVPFAVLRISNGDVSVDLLGSIECVNWRPAGAGLKGGGEWLDSPWADGRHLRRKSDTNVVESYTLQVKTTLQDSAIHATQDLVRLLESAMAYDPNGPQSMPVWLEARSTFETESRFVMIEAGWIPQLPDPYHQPFWSDPDWFYTVMSNFDLIIEHEPAWRAVAPGQRCGETRSETEDLPIWYLEMDGDTSEVDCGSGATIDDLPDFAVAGKGQITAEAWIRADSYGEGGIGHTLYKDEWNMIVWNVQGLRARVSCAGGDAISESGLDEFTADGEWHHVLMTYDETGAGTPAARTIYLAIDGVWVTTYVTQDVSAGNYVSDAADDLLIGNNAAGTAGFDGGFGWSRVSDSVRYDPAGGDFTPVLRCEMPIPDVNTMMLVIYEGEGATTVDLSVNGNDGAIANADWARDCTFSNDIECDCVQASGLQENWFYEGWQVSTAAPVGLVKCMIELQNTAGRMLAAESGQTVWRSDDGAAWAAAAVSPAAAFNPSTIVEDLDSGDVYLTGADGGAREVWRSQDAGVNWAIRAAANGSNIEKSIAWFTGDGYLYMCDQSAAGAVFNPISRSIDGGATWVIVENIEGFDFASILSASDGYLYATGSTRGVAASIVGRIYRSSDGDNWEIVCQAQTTSSFRGIFEVEGWLLAALDLRNQLWGSQNGTEWSLVAVTPGPTVFADIIDGPDGRLYAENAQGYIYAAWEPTDWMEIARPTNNSGGLVDYSGNDQVYSGQLGEIDASGPFATFGRDPTCVDEVVVSNKQNTAQLTHVFVYDTGTATYTDEFPAAAFPYGLFPDPPATGDILYIGLTTAILDDGPFNNVIFDIAEMIGATAWTVNWEYLSNPVGPAFTALVAHDETASFSRLGVKALTFEPPAGWVLGAVNGVTGWWIRARLSGVAGAVSPPTQQRRDLYTVTWPDVSIDDLQVGGDLPALLRIRAHNRSDEDGVADDEPEAWISRMLVGLRSVSRSGYGERFISSLNLSDEQNQIGVTVSTGANTAFANDLEAPSGRRMTHTGTGASTWTDEGVVSLGPSIARDFFGKFHVYLRAQQVAGASGDVRVRFQVRSGSGGILFTSLHSIFNNTNPWQLVDLRTIRIPPSGAIRYDELTDELDLVVQIWSSAARTVYLYDLKIMPTDEWFGEFVDKAFLSGGMVGIDKALEIDSISIPKLSYRSLVREWAAAGDGLITSEYRSRTAREAILQSNADQRLHFLAARGCVTGTMTAAGPSTTLTDAAASFDTSGVREGQEIYNVTDSTSGNVTGAVGGTTVVTDVPWTVNDEYIILCPNWRSEPWLLSSIQLNHVARYRFMRGAR